MARQHIEVIDGKEFVVTKLPQDPRLTPSATKKRQLFSAFSHHEKAEAIRAKKRAAKLKRKRSRKR